MSVAKEEAMKLISEIPETATWDDIMYELYVRRKVEAGIKADDAGKTVPHEEVKKRYPCE